MRGPKRRARCISFNPSHTCFKPCGVRGRGLETQELRADEFEALRLMDYEGLYQEECAQRMGVSRPTFSRMIAEARRKVADVLVHGKRLLIVADSSAAVMDEAKGAESPEVSTLKSSRSSASAESEASPCAASPRGAIQDATDDFPAQG
jgi:uncharacterized protein